MSNTTTAEPKNPPVDGIAKALGVQVCSSCTPRHTDDNFVQAVTQASAAAKSMGDSWTPMVFENLGWHAKIYNELVYIHMRESTESFGAFLREGAPFAGRGKTPQEALADLGRGADVYRDGALHKWALAHTAAQEVRDDT